MLMQRLIGGSLAAKPLTFVGSAADPDQDTQTPSYSLTALTGGVASAPAIGDIVIACVAFKNSTDQDVTCTTSGYTEVADLYSNSTNDCQLGVFYKVLTAADTTVAFDLGVASNVYFVAHVWRNVNATPLDVTSTTSTGTTGVPNAPSITTVTNNAVVIAIGAAAGDTTNTIGTLTVPSGMGNLTTAGESNFSRVGIASFAQTTAGAYDPAAFGGGNANAACSFCAVTLALRPA